MYCTDLVVVLVALVLAATEGAKQYPDKDGSHSISAGSRLIIINKPADVHLFHETINAKGFLLSVQSQDVCYPPKDSVQDIFTVTHYNVVDYTKAGLAYVKKYGGGGVGRNKVCFHLKSRRGKGYHFVIDVYGTHLY